MSFGKNGLVFLSTSLLVATNLSLTSCGNNPEPVIRSNSMNVKLSDESKLAVQSSSLTSSPDPLRIGSEYTDRTSSNLPDGKGKSIVLGLGCNTMDKLCIVQQGDLLISEIGAGTTSEFVSYQEANNKCSQLNRRSIFILNNKNVSVPYGGAWRLPNQSEYDSSAKLGHRLIYGGNSEAIVNFGPIDAESWYKSDEQARWGLDTNHKLRYFCVSDITSPIIENKPIHGSNGVFFVDQDPMMGYLSGPIVIKKSLDESDVSHYAIFWGNSSAQKLALPPIAVIPKTGADLKYILPIGTKKPAGATTILVFSRNYFGDMAYPTDRKIYEMGPPLNAAADTSFFDSDSVPDSLTGDLWVVRAQDEADVKEYLLYWGSSANQKLSSAPTAFASIPVSKGFVDPYTIFPSIYTGTELFSKFSRQVRSITLSARKVPVGATHILVRSKNANGEMQTGPSRLIVDGGKPRATDYTPSVTYSGQCNNITSNGMAAYYMLGGSFYSYHPQKSCGQN